MQLMIVWCYHYCYLYRYHYDYHYDDDGDDDYYHYCDYDYH